MSALPSIRLIVTTVVYFTVISLGAGILVINTAPFLFTVPLLAGSVLLGHAIKTTNLDELGYATMCLWAAVLALGTAGMVTEEFILHRDVSPLAEIPVVRVLGTFSLITIPVVAYGRGVQTAAEEGDQSLVTT